MKYYSLLFLVFCLVTVTVGAATGVVNPASGYHIAKKTVLGGEGGWDYLYCDSAARRIYLSRSTHVMVVDADSYAVIGDIPNTPGVHGIVIVPDLNKGFTSNGRDNSVTIFDLKTLKETGKVAVGKNPDAIMYDPASKRVFTFNGGSQDTTAIDAGTDKVVGTVGLGGKPEFAVSDEKGHVYVNIEDKSEVAQLDSNKLAVDARWSLAPGEEPSGLAIDRKHHRLFSVCSNKLMVVLNTDNGKVVTTLPIGSGTDAAAFDPDTGFAFSSNGEGTLTVVHEDSPDKFTVAESVPTQRGARTMTLDQKTHRLFSVSAEYGPTPAPTTERPRPRPPMLPGTFTLLVLEK
jgi:YVTN family beta-propeller protein